MKDVFDFSDISDLPAEIAEGMETAVSNKAQEWAQVLIAAQEAGYDRLTLKQVAAVAYRMGYTVPKRSTVRNYLNAAVAQGLIGKPTRSTYSADTSVVAEGDDDEADESTADAPVAAGKPKKADNKADKKDPLADV